MQIDLEHKFFLWFWPKTDARSVDIGAGFDLVLKQHQSKNLPGGRSPWCFSRVKVEVVEKVCFCMETDPTRVEEGRICEIQQKKPGGRRAWRSSKVGAGNAWSAICKFIWQTWFIWKTTKVCFYLKTNPRSLLVRYNSSRVVGALGVSRSGSGKSLICSLRLPLKPEPAFPHSRYFPISPASGYYQPPRPPWQMWFPVNSSGWTTGT